MYVNKCIVMNIPLLKKYYFITFNNIFLVNYLEFISTKISLKKRNFDFLCSHFGKNIYVSSIYLDYSII